MPDVTWPMIWYVGDRSAVMSARQMKNWELALLGWLVFAMALCLITI